MVTAGSWHQEKSESQTDHSENFETANLIHTFTSVNSVDKALLVSLRNMKIQKAMSTQ